MIQKCHSVGIRLADAHSPGDFPYYCSEGFRDEFLRKESALVRCVDGKRVLASGLFF